MSKKMWVAFGLAALLLGYLALQPKGDMPVNGSEEKSAATGVGEAQFEPLPGEPADAVSSPDLADSENSSAIEDNGLAGKLVESLHADSQLVEAAVIHSVECTDASCTVELEPKGSEDVQARMAKFLQTHPEFGSSYKVAASEDPKVTQFILGREKL